MKSYLRRLPRALCILLAISVFQPFARAQTIDAAAVDQIIQESLKAWQVPGAALAIVRGDEVVYLKGYGVKELGGEMAVTADTLFAIGSTTKAFTTTAMAMLVDEGKMSWDDQVRKHIPFFRLSDPLANEYVTMRDIVSHRTGLSRNDLLWYNSPWEREEIIRKIGLVKLNRPFRSAYQYQNIMFLTAGYAVGLASKSTFEEFVQRRIFDPLAMTTANFSATVAAKAADRASPHRQTRDGKVEVIPWFNLDNAGPAGSINASARDMSKWVRFQLGDGTFEGKRLVSASNMAEMHSPQMVVPLDKAANPHSTMMSYGLAWFIQDYKGHQMVSHTGGIDGFRARVVLMPASKLGLVILTNSSVGTSSASMHLAASNSVVDLLLGLSKKDWNAYYRDQFKNVEAQTAAFEKRREAMRHKETKPSRELASYAGSYDDPAYGRASVVVEDGALALRWSKFKSRLEHYHYDTFAAREDNPLAGDLVLFKLGPDGEVASVSFLGVEFAKVRGKN